MKKMTNEQRRRQLEAVAAMADDQVDTSDIPELTYDQLQKGVRGRLYRPIKRPVTMRLDADIIQWLKAGGPGYQTKANRLLRAAMQQSLARSRNNSTQHTLAKQAPATSRHPRMKRY
jgi:uncharacterized protein (DUF4415 family)